MIDINRFELSKYGAKLPVSMEKSLQDNPHVDLLVFLKKFVAISRQAFKVRLITEYICL